VIRFTAATGRYKVNDVMSSESVFGFSSCSIEARDFYPQLHGRTVQIAEVG